MQCKHDRFASWDANPSYGLCDASPPVLVVRVFFQVRICHQYLEPPQKSGHFTINELYLCYRDLATTPQLVVRESMVLHFIWLSVCNGVIHLTDQHDGAAHSPPNGDAWQNFYVLTQLTEEAVAPINRLVTADKWVGPRLCVFKIRAYEL